MDALEIATEKETSSVAELVKYAFGKGGKVWENAFPYYQDHTISFVDRTDGEITSQVSVIPFELNFHGVNYPSTGIGYVASYPEVRGNGAMKRIFQNILSWEHDEGKVLSLLDPFSYEFYGKLGYEHAYNRMKLIWKASDFPRGERTNMIIKRMEYLEALPFLREIHGKSAEVSRGSMVREDWWWTYWHQKRMPEEKIAICFDEAMQPVSYLIYTVKFPVFTVHEWVSISDDGLHAMTTFIQSHSSSVETIVWVAPFERADEVPVLSLMKEKRKVQMEILPYMQVRIVDVSKFLANYPWKETVPEIAFRVRDDLAEWNNGLFLATGENVDTTETPIVEMDIREMVQVFFCKGRLNEKKLSLFAHLHTEPKCLLDVF